MKTFKNFFLICSLYLTCTSLYAYVPVVDTLLGEMIDKTLLIAGKSSFDQFKHYNVVNDPKGIARIKKVLKNLYAFSGNNFRYVDPTIRIIVGIENEANAYSLGPTIYISKELLTLLNEGELTAVLAHEIAHSEEGHLLARMVYVTGTPVLYLRNLIFSEIYSYTTGEADEYMKRIMNEGQMALVTEILEHSTLAQEMQADCEAANWLEKGRRAGWKVSPLDLNRATNKIMGVDIGKIENDNTFPPVIRYKAVSSGRYIGSRCSL